MTDQADGPWRSIASDPLFCRPPTQGPPGHVPAGGDLRLDIGWDRFEQLLVAVAPGFVGLSEVQFRRYGVRGQAQRGIDLAGRRADGSYVVVQCKDYQKFTAADLSKAVKTFTTGSRPFNAQHLVVAVSTPTGHSQLADRLAALGDEHPDLQIDLRGAEQINDALRQRGDVVARFWTRETADTFCTGAPPAGVGAPAPNWLHVADQVLLGPLEVDGADEQLATADALRADDPAGAAEVYRQLADRLDAEGFTGHAFVVRSKQLDALGEAGKGDAAVELTARLAATALHEGDVHHAELLSRRFDTLARDQAAGGAGEHQPEGTTAGAVDRGDQMGPDRARHAKLIRAAVHLARHPLNDRGALVDLLCTAPPDSITPGYQPLLVLLVAETILADAIGTPTTQPVIAATNAPTPPGAPAMTSPLAELDDLIASAITQTTRSSSATVDKDTQLRLRLVRASYDTAERETLLDQVLQRRLPRPRDVLVLAAQARRYALDGLADRATAHWRQAVQSAIHEGLTDDAAGWLYAIRTVNSRYGPWRRNIGDEHLLAQALPKTSSGRLIRRVRDPETDAYRATLRDEPIEAIRAAHRWLADSIVTGDWVDEHGATELLGDLYARNAEPDRAAACYQWIGETTKLTKLARDAGDHLLPFSPIGVGPWWQQASSLAGLATQKDLLDDDTAGHLLPALLDLVARGRAGELTEGPTRALTLQATKTACAFAARGTITDAQALLDLFADDVARQPNHYTEHVQACKAIAAHHPQLTWPALVRIFDLAEVATHEALTALDSPLVRDLLHDPAAASDGEPADVSSSPLSGSLTAEQRQQLRERLQTMAAEHYDAGVALVTLGGTDPATTQRAVQARDRLLRREEPCENSGSGGTNMVSDSYLVAKVLDPADQRACLDKMVTVAEDRREVAPNRHDALAAACNLVIDQDDDVKTSVHARSRAFADGAQDGSAFDDQVTNPHPLSSMKVDLGPATLRASGLDLALRSAVSKEDRQWVRERAVGMLRDDDERLVRVAAVTLSRLGAKTPDTPDAALLAVHPLRVVRKLAAVIAVATPIRYVHALRDLAADPDGAVRSLLARVLHEARTTAAADPLLAEAAPTHDVGDQQQGLAIITEVLAMLAEDARHTVRRAAAGHPIT